MVGEFAVRKQAKILSKGRVTVPKEVRRILGVSAGDQILFVSDGKGVHIRPINFHDALEKYRGIGNHGIPSGRRAINRWIREMRGHLD